MLKCPEILQLAEGRRGLDASDTQWFNVIFHIPPAFLQDSVPTEFGTWVEKWCNDENPHNGRGNKRPRKLWDLYLLCDSFYYNRYEPFRWDLEQCVENLKLGLAGIFRTKDTNIYHDRNGRRGNTAVEGGSNQTDGLSSILASKLVHAFSSWKCLGNTQYFAGLVASKRVH